MAGDDERQRIEMRRGVTGDNHAAANAGTLDFQRGARHGRRRLAGRDHVNRTGRIVAAAQRASGQAPGIDRTKSGLKNGQEVFSKLWKSRGQ